ncbi:hypothetical protein DSM112329_03237 [Paraconexibacter sp. AEG42_29]|uniref:SRPBCC domain-containing protein n=1 Tax=Paraconexibacter sp. AEG42_29 TaxID=2997339 RepID=A0AAU7AXD0_9ACTN
MADGPRPYTAKHVAAASPWDVYECLTDPDDMAQWRGQHTMAISVADAYPYTKVEFNNGMVVELEPEDGGTLLKARRSRSSNGMTGRVGRLLTSRKNVEEELLEVLRRIASVAEHGKM